MGERVRQRRAELGLTQAQLAEKVGVSQVAIKKIEQGGGSKFRLELAKALDVSMEWLSTGDGPKIAKNTGYWPFSYARLEEYEQLPPLKKTELDIRVSEFIAGALESDQAEESKRA